MFGMKFAVSILLCVSFTHSASAEQAPPTNMDAREIVRLYRSDSDPLNVYRVYLSSLMEGIWLANNMNENQGKAKQNLPKWVTRSYCPNHHNAVLTNDPDEAVAIMRIYLSKHFDEGIYNAGIVLTAALGEMYPCKGKEP